MFSLVRMLEVREESLSRTYRVVIIELFSCYPYNRRFVGKATGASLEADSEMKVHGEGMLENIPRWEGKLGQRRAGSQAKVLSFGSETQDALKS